LILFVILPLHSTGGEADIPPGGGEGEGRHIHQEEAE